MILSSRSLPNAGHAKKDPRSLLGLYSNPCMGLSGSPYLPVWNNSFTGFSSLPPVRSLKMGSACYSSSYNLSTQHDEWHTQPCMRHKTFCGMNGWLKFQSDFPPLEHFSLQRVNDTLKNQRKRSVPSLKRDVLSDKDVESETHELKSPTTTSSGIQY